MNATMHKLNGNPKLDAAIARCRKAHPKAVRLSSTQVRVSGRTGNRYTVTLAAPKPGLLLAACDCPAGQAGQVCYHLAASAIVPGTVATSNVPSAPASPTSPSAPSASIPAAAHAHQCQACGQGFSCDFPFCWEGAEVVCAGCYAAGARVWDAPKPQPVAASRRESVPCRGRERAAALGSAGVMRD